jgi:hypothetical protein
VSENKKHKIQYEEDFVDCIRFKNSLNKILEKYPDGVSDDIICKVLDISQNELDNLFQDAIVQLKKDIAK